MKSSSKQSESADSGPPFTPTMKESGRKVPGAMMLGAVAMLSTTAASQSPGNDDDTSDYVADRETLIDFLSSPLDTLNEDGSVDTSLFPPKLPFPEMAFGKMDEKN